MSKPKTTFQHSDREGTAEALFLGGKPFLPKCHGVRMGQTDLFRTGKVRQYKCEICGNYASVIWETEAGL